MQVIDEKQNEISERIGLKDETKKVLSAIKTMGEKCQEILMLASEGMSMQEMQEVTQVKSLGTVLSRLRKSPPSWPVLCTIALSGVWSANRTLLSHY